tara:strand:- start:34006 stop:34455 length:450 start_codon:yes stop_codon:yes gene_type:complete
MDNSVLDILSIGQVVQAAVAPVFLITGVGTLLGILSNRLSRVTDRARALEARLITNELGEQVEPLQSLELDLLWRRARLLNNAFMLCSMSALTVCLVVVMLFFSYVFAISLSMLISLVFILSMLFLISGLTLLLREVITTTQAIGHRIE